ncbi:MAG: flagellar hook-basal body complex protein [Lachnospiraceae bacterium]|nr:flagellar hook-basal body complex protein [Lachnospiraceae bacterium]
MMRSLFSGVAGLKVHQTRMDVIGNNIANVNTTSYKSQSMVFSDLLYQTTQAASGANAATGRGGTNARQIGLGAKTGAISTAITTQGSAQSTNNPFDIMITGDSFFVVSNGSENFFTRDGSFTVDGAGNLVMSSTGYTVMGWQTDKETGEIIPDTVSALKVMNADNLTYPPESTTSAYVSGILDKYDSNTTSSTGKIITLNFFDKLGYTYTAKFSIHATDEEGNYKVRLDDILDEAGDSLVTKYNLNSINDIASFGETTVTTSEALYEVLSNVTCDATATPPVYSQVLSGEEVLKGFGDNSMIKLADTWEIAATAGTQVSAGSTVDVKGTVTLDKNTLEGEPFNLIFESDGAGNNKYYYNAADPGADPVKGQEVTDWTDALTSLNVTGIDGTPTVDADGNLVINFTQTFEATKESVVADTKSFKSQITPLEAFGLENSEDTTYQIDFTSQDGLSAQIIKTVTQTGNNLVYDIENGKFKYVGTVNNDSVTMAFNAAATSKTGDTIDLINFSDIDIDFSLSNMFNNGGTSTIGATNGDKNGYNTGRKTGEMIGIEVGQDGKITASYDNGQTKLLGQIAVASFANASGLSKQGDNLYSATMNSGEFDGIGKDITAEGGYMTSGVLEMSNVDLSSEFTEMITTQRGFQANSRIITTSDSMLEELVNLKR